MESESDYEFIIKSLRHYISRLEALKFEEEIKHLTDYIHSDLQANITKAKHAIEGIKKMENEQTVRLHSTTLSLSLKLLEYDLQNGSKYLKESLGMEIPQETTQAIIKKCGQFQTLYCK